MEHASFEAYLAQLERIFPFALIPAGTAFFVAMLIDLDLRDAGLAGWRLRLFEAIILPASMGAVGFLVGHLRLSLGITNSSPAMLMLMQGGLGFILGGAVPHLYRGLNARSEPDAELEAD